MGTAGLTRPERCQIKMYFGRGGVNRVDFVICPLGGACGVFGQQIAPAAVPNRALPQKCIIRNSDIYLLNDTRDRMAFEM